MTWRTHSCVPQRHSPQTSRQTIENTRGPDVAHALLRAASALVPTPRDRKNVECRQEWRHGTQECVRHQNPPPSDWAWQKVCSARDVPEGIVPRSWRSLGNQQNRRRRQERESIPLGMSLAPQASRCAGDGGRGCEWRTHSFVPPRHSCRRRGIAKSLSVAKSGDTARKSACATSNPAHHRLSGGRFVATQTMLGVRRGGRLKIGRRIKSCPTTDFSTAVFPIPCGEVFRKCRPGRLQFATQPMLASKHSLGVLFNRHSCLSRIHTAKGQQ